MWEENNVIIIDDHEQRRYDAALLLDFLGENPISYSVSEWESLSQQDAAKEQTRQIKALFIGDTHMQSLEACFCE